MRICCPRDADHLSPRFSSIIAYSLGVTGSKHSGMLEALTGQSLRQLGKFSTLGMSNLAPLMRAVSRRYTTRVSEATTLGLSNVAWAFARLGFNDVELMRDIASEFACIWSNVDG